MSVRTMRQTDRGRAAVDLLGALYPSPLEVQVAPSNRALARAEWTAIPSPGNPRLLMPVAEPAAATRMLRRQLTGHRLRTRVARAGLSLAVRGGALTRLPRLGLAVVGPPSARSIEDPLREVLGADELLLTMPIGPARSNRKPVLQVTDPGGQVLAFVKVGHTPLTAELVRQEGITLRRLEGAGFSEVRIPHTVATLHWAGFEVLVLEPLDIPSRRLAGEAGRRRLLSVVRELAEVGGRTVVDWQDHPYRSALLTRLEHCGELAVALRRQLDRIAPRLPVSTGSWHGDLNSGNVALVPQPCPVWDWERFESGVPVGFDLLHHQLHDAITVRGEGAAQAARTLLSDAGRTLAPLEVEPATSDAVARAYLVTLATRYLVDDQVGAGADLGRVHEWLLPTLEGVTS